MLQFLVRERQRLHTSDQMQKLVVNDCEMSSTKKLWNIIHSKYHFKIVNNKHAGRTNNAAGRSVRPRLHI